DAVAHDLIDGALVAMHRVHHAFQHRVENAARFFGVAVGEQLHGALEVGEEHRDLLALAFQGAAGANDPLGQMLRRVVLWGRRRAGGGRVGWERAATRSAESLARRRSLTTVRASELQPGAAVLTEPGPLGVLRLALRTLHRWPSRPWAHRAHRSPDGSALPCVGATEGQTHLLAGGVVAGWRPDAGRGHLAHLRV